MDVFCPTMHREAVCNRWSLTERYPTLTHCAWGVYRKEDDGERTASLSLEIPSYLFPKYLHYHEDKER